MKLVRYGLGLQVRREWPWVTLQNFRLNRSSLYYNLDRYFVFSRSYCYTVWSAIGIILSSLCPSVCLWRCALWLSGLVYRAKSCTSVFLAGVFLFVGSDTFAVGPMYRLATKRATKKRVEENASVSFFHDHASVHYLLLTCRGLSSSRLSGFSDWEWVCSGTRWYVPRLCSLEFDVMYHGAGGVGRGGLLLAQEEYSINQ